MKSKLQLILMLVFVALFQSASAQKGSKKPEIDMVKLMQHRSKILQKAAAQQQQQASEASTSAQGSRPSSASQGTNGTATDKNNKPATDIKRDEE
jgi:hypothetical protein